MTITRYHVLDRLLRRRHRQRLEAAEQVDQLIAEWVDPAAVDAEAFVTLQARDQLVQRALERLPADQRRVIRSIFFGNGETGVTIGSQTELQSHVRQGLSRIFRWSCRVSCQFARRYQKFGTHPIRESSA